jgi:V/A-type H+-transporting ATPase subunit D
MALLQLKKRIMLAQKGHELLKKKRDSLVMQFFDLVSERKTLRSKAHEQLEEAYASLMEAQMLVGKRELENLSLAIPVTAEFDVRVYNLWASSFPSSI